MTGPGKPRPVRVPVRIKPALKRKPALKSVSGTRLAGYTPAPPLPPHGQGLRIGLLGGSFNPPHAAHRLISLIAMRRLDLDAVWWLVTPGNPLKEHKALPEIATRMAWARAVKQHPRIRITDIEGRIGTRYSIDTLGWLRQHAPRTRFVWLMGSDNLASFHRWKDWKALARLMPIAVIDRPGSTLPATSSRAAQALKMVRQPEILQQALPGRAAPAWIFLHDRRSALSSTAIRAGQAR